MNSTGNNKTSTRVYMDYAATTPVDERVLEAMQPFFGGSFANPNSKHEEGRKASEALRMARKEVAEKLGCGVKEVVFTGSGTESNNLAVLGTYEKFVKKESLRPHFITTNIEHSSVDGVFKHLENEKKAEVDLVAVDSNGIVNVDDIRKKIKENTVLISIMYVNNEIGTIQPIEEISHFMAEVNKKREIKIVFHVDASQAPLYFSVNVGKLGVDLLTIDAQKIYGPKGVGALYVKRGSEPNPVLWGGSQERGLRPGTENVPAIVGFAKALSLATEERERESFRLRDLQQYFFEKIDRELPKARVNGSRSKRSPNNINISIGSMEGDYLTLLLDKEGVAVSSASACQSGAGIGSRVVRELVLATGKSDSANAVRFSMGRSTTKDEIDFVVKKLKKIAG